MINKVLSEQIISQVCVRGTNTHIEKSKTDQLVNIWKWATQKLKIICSRRKK